MILTARILGWLRASTLLLAELLAGCTPHGTTKSPEPPEPDHVDYYGGLELVTHTHAYRTANYNSLATSESWSLRWKGQPLEIDTMMGMFSDQPTRTRTVNAVYVLGTGEVPDLLVNVGDPNNTGAYHLLHQQDGELSAPMLCPIRAGDSSVMPLGTFDGPQEPPGGFHGPRHLRLGGARWLLLGQNCVLDVVRRRALEVPRWPYDGFTAYPSVLPAARVRDISPDGHSLVRLGSLRKDGDDLDQLIVADLERQQLSTLPIDRDRMRYDSYYTLDNAWLYHHFEWRRGPDGRDTLRERAHFKPLPWRGTLGPDGHSYAIHTVWRDPSATYADFLVRRFQAQPLPVEPGGHGQGFMVRGERVTVKLSSMWTRVGEPSEALIREIAAAFDAELATGQHDALFVAPQGTP